MKLQALSFDKSPENWPYKNLGVTALDTSFRSAMNRKTIDAVKYEIDIEGQLGSEIGFHPTQSNAALQGGLRDVLSRLLQVDIKDIALQVNTEGAVDALMQRYPFSAGDKVVAYSGDYPSVFEPLTRRKKVEIKFLDGFRDEHGVPERFSLDELDSKLSGSKAEWLVISHVLYRSGQKLPLERIRDICTSHGTRLLVDVAQSIGVIPINPLDIGADAVVFPMWKGLRGPRGVAALVTSPEITKILLASDMRHHKVLELIKGTHMTALGLGDAREFQPSTLPTTCIAGAKAAIESAILPYAASDIEQEVLRLQALFFEKMNKDLLRPVLAPEEAGGLILALRLAQGYGSEERVVAAAREERIRITNRDGMLRVAPGPEATDEEIVRAADILNTIAGKYAA